MYACVCERNLERLDVSAERFTFRLGGRQELCEQALVRCLTFPLFLLGVKLGGVRVYCTVEAVEACACRGVGGRSGAERRLGRQGSDISFKHAICMHV